MRFGDCDGKAGGEGIEEFFLEQEKGWKEGDLASGFHDGRRSRKPIESS